MRIWLRRVRSGESGALPVIIGLIVLGAYFQLSQHAVPVGGQHRQPDGPGGLDHHHRHGADVRPAARRDRPVRRLQRAPSARTITFWMLAVKQPVADPVAILAGLVVCTAIATIEGLIIVWLRIPSFVVTLAGLLGLNGVLILPVRCRRERRQRRDHHPTGQHASSMTSCSAISRPAVGWIVADRRRRGSAGFHDHAGPAQAGARPGRAAAERDAAQDRRDGRRSAWCSWLVSTQPRQRVHRRSRACPGWCRSCWAARAHQHAARPHQVRPVHLRHRRQRRGGQAGGRQPRPDPRAGVRVCGAFAGITGILYASYLGSISNELRGRPVRAVLRRRQP